MTSAKATDNTGMARLLAVLADERRLRILRLLVEGELCVCELVDILDRPQYEVSRHLAALRKAGLVTDRRQGLWAYYAISDQVRTEPLLRDLLAVVARHAQRSGDTVRDERRRQRRVALRQAGRCVVGLAETKEA